MKLGKVSKSFLALVIFGILLSVWGFLIEPGLLVQKDIAMPEWKGPKLRIAFLSDLHAGAPHINEDYIQNMVGRINEMSPDLILIGGDLVINGVVGGKAMPVEKVAELLQGLKAPLGTFAVMGNHDWWNDTELIQKSLHKVGIEVLENKAKLFTTPSSSFWLVGIGDHFTKHAEPEKAFAQINQEHPKILFMHDPAALFLVKKSFDIALAGHMHGGQIFIPGLGALVTPGDSPSSWAQGWVDFPLGSVFVSKGVGTSILPVRINAPPEFVILDLKQ